MQVVTWNVNSVMARLDFALDYLATRAPDVVCLQELKVDDDGFPRLAFAQAGYAAVTHGQPQWNGVAVLVKQSAGPAPELIQAGLPGQEAMGARLVSVRALGLDVTSVYVPNGKTLEHPDYQAKLAWLDALVAHLEPAAKSDRPTVVAGDFNLVPEALDTWSEPALAGQIFHTDAERARWRALCALGFTDLYRHLHPSEQAFSWWDYRGGAFHKKQGLRIDFVLGNAAATARARSALIDRDFRKKRAERTASDHAPVAVELA